MSGTNHKQYVMPDIGLRAVQGHSTRGDISLAYLIAAQEQFESRTSRFALSLRSWDRSHNMESIVQTHSLIPGGLAGSRAAVHFAVSLPGDNGRIVSGFRTNSVIYIFLKLETMAERWKRCIPLN